MSPPAVAWFCSPFCSATDSSRGPADKWLCLTKTRRSARGEARGLLFNRGPCDIVDRGPVIGTGRVIGFRGNLAHALSN